MMRTPWISQLSSKDAEKVEEAVTQLEHLKDPKAIKPLGELWKRQHGWPRVLRIIVALADQPQAEGGPFWEDVIPYLVEAVENVDVDDARSRDNAVFATNTLRKAADPETAQVLIATVGQKWKRNSPGQRVRIAAVHALGQFGSNPKALETLITVLNTDPKKQPPQLNAAAAIALAETKNSKALEPLLTALYEIPLIFHQVRRAITSIGPSAVPVLLQVFEGKHAAMNALAKKHKFAMNCEVAQGPRTSCIAPGNLKFKAAGLLGDMRAKQALPALLATLKKKPQVAFFDPKTGAPGPPDHAAVLNALRLIGDPKAAAGVLAYVKNPATDDLVRPVATDVYSILAHGSKGMKYLAAEMQNPSADHSEQIKKASALAYSRLVTKESQLKPLNYLIKRYGEKAKEHDKKASKASKERDKQYQERTADGYRGLVTEFQQYRARGQIGIMCGDKASCYVELLDQKPDQIVKLLRIPNPKKLTKQQKAAYRIAAVERSLFELLKMGPKARPVLDKLLETVASSERIVRELVLVALVRVAESPCEKCAARLAEVVELQKGQTTLDGLTLETRIMSNYFSSQKGLKK